MKTYNIFATFLVFAIIGCGKTEEVTVTPEEESNDPKSSITLLLNNGSGLSAQLLDFNEKSIDFGAGESTFETTAMPQLSYRDGSELVLYQTERNCKGEVTLHDFKEDTSQKTTVFADLTDCNHTANAIARSTEALFIAYTLTDDTDKKTHFVRIFDLNSETFDDIAFTEKPVQLLFANSKLFILTFDEDITDENTLVVLDVTNNEQLHDMNLGFNVKQIFKKSESTIIISYNELHTVFQTSTMAVEYINYTNGNEPKFTLSRSNYFDTDDKMYYLRPSDEVRHPNIPAVYDFSSKNISLYAYENFLPEDKITTEFDIGDTTMVSYDAANNMILVGYKKTSDPTKGGLLRLKPLPDTEFIDNLDVDGIPYTIFMK